MLPLHSSHAWTCLVNEGIHLQLYAEHKSCSSNGDDKNWDYNSSEPDPEISQLGPIVLIAID